jgi:predicted amidophosphoribosyltransferase
MDEEDFYEQPHLCAICGQQVDFCEICEDCAEAIEVEGIDPHEENPYEEYGFDYPWELEY